MPSEIIEINAIPPPFADIRDRIDPPPVIRVKVTAPEAAADLEIVEEKPWNQKTTE